MSGILLKYAEFKVNLIRSTKNSEINGGSRERQS